MPDFRVKVSYLFENKTTKNFNFWVTNHMENHVGSRGDLASLARLKAADAVCKSILGARDGKKLEPEDMEEMYFDIKVSATLVPHPQTTQRKELEKEHEMLQEQIKEHEEKLKQSQARIKEIEKTPFFQAKTEKSSGLTTQNQKAKLSIPVAPSTSVSTKKRKISSSSPQNNKN